jgi:hypothetical protein
VLARCRTAASCPAASAEFMPSTAFRRHLFQAEANNAEVGEAAESVILK